MVMTIMSSALVSAARVQRTEDGKVVGLGGVWGNLAFNGVDFLPPSPDDKVDFPLRLVPPEGDGPLIHP